MSQPPHDPTYYQGVDPYTDTYYTDNSVSGRVVIITDGAKDLATGFAEAGARGIVIVASTPARAAATEAEVRRNSPGVLTLAVAVDTADPAAVDDLFAAIGQRFGQTADILVNNAPGLQASDGGVGGNTGGGVLEEDPDRWWNNFVSNPFLLPIFGPFPVPGAGEYDNAAVQQASSSSSHNRRASGSGSGSSGSRQDYPSPSPPHFTPQPRRSHPSSLHAAASGNASSSVTTAYRPSDEELALVERLAAETVAPLRLLVSSVDSASSSLRQHPPFRITYTDPPFSGTSTAAQQQQHLQQNQHNQPFGSHRSSSGHSTMQRQPFTYTPPPYSAMFEEDLARLAVLTLTVGSGGYQFPHLSEEGEEQQRQGRQGQGQAPPPPRLGGSFVVTRAFLAAAQSAASSNGPAADSINMTAAELTSTTTLTTNLGEPPRPIARPRPTIITIIPAQLNAAITSHIPLFPTELRPHEHLSAAPTSLASFALQHLTSTIASTSAAATDSTAPMRPTAVALLVDPSHYPEELESGRFPAQVAYTATERVGSLLNGLAVPNRGDMWRNREELVRRYGGGEG